MVEEFLRFPFFMNFLRLPPLSSATANLCGTARAGRLQKVCTIPAQKASSFLSFAARTATSIEKQVTLGAALSAAARRQGWRLSNCTKTRRMLHAIRKHLPRLGLLLRPRTRVLRRSRRKRRKLRPPRRAGRVPARRCRKNLGFLAAVRCRPPLPMRTRTLQRQTPPVPNLPLNHDHI